MENILEKGYSNSKKYIITAGNYNTDLGIVGSADTLLGAKRIGRKVVKESLPDGCGNYKVRTKGQIVFTEKRTLFTRYKWVPV